MDDELRAALDAVLDGIDVTQLPILPKQPAHDERDVLPRRRNPQIGCYEHPSGTWIHGRPHNCPKWLRR
jgi:hypothetical protein